MDAELYNRLRDKVMNGMGWTFEKAELWMETQNPNLGGVSPLTLIVNGRGHWLEKWIDNALDENTPPKQGER